MSPERRLVRKAYGWAVAQDLSHDDAVALVASLLGLDVAAVRRMFEPS